MLSLARSSHILSSKGEHTNEAFAGIYSDKWRRLTREEYIKNDLLSCYFT